MQLPIPALSPSLVVSLAASVMLIGCASRTRVGRPEGEGIRAVVDSTSYVLRGRAPSATVRVTIFNPSSDTIFVRPCGTSRDVTVERLDAAGGWHAVTPGYCPAIGGVPPFAIPPTQRDTFSVALMPGPGVELSMLLGHLRIVVDAFARKSPIGERGVEALPLQERATPPFLVRLEQ
jgi:hypothetical protein